MFTVPKERLRVVNADENEGLEEESQIAELVDPTNEKEMSEKVEGREEVEEDAPRGRDPEKQDLLSVGPPLTKTDSGGDPHRLSHSTFDSATIRSDPGVLLTAQAVTVERPRTKVLQMVDTIETRSREGSPAR
jgi:hypothetical protein